MHRLGTLKDAGVRAGVVHIGRGEGGGVRREGWTGGGGHRVADAVVEIVGALPARGRKGLAGDLVMIKR